MRHSSCKMCFKGHHMTTGQHSLLRPFCCALMEQLLQGCPKGLALLPVMQCLYLPLLATQQPKSGCRQKPRRPSCPDKPEMGVGQAQSISAAIPKGHTATHAKRREWSQPLWKAVAVLWLWSMRKDRCQMTRRPGQI